MYRMTSKRKNSANCHREVANGSTILSREPCEQIIAKKYNNNAEKNNSGSNYNNLEVLRPRRL